MSERTVTPVPTLLGYVRTAVYLLASLVALALLVVGTVAVIAELKGTWHWSIHLESTISYAGLFVGWLLVALVPLTGALFAGRVLYE
ncbi:hypothetical protein BRD15_08745 [Halobacteriales archaeon SW_6_65_15]|jgi:hypothetical protein|nr:MAG: hypothetical protein BRD15_08745 [Halobacteriales archaeon SW_6_65_15]